MGSSTIFSGNSRYATDFTSIIDRAVSIASLPMLQMQKDRVGMSDRSSALSSLTNTITSLSSAFATLGKATGLGSYAASISDGAVLRATLAEGAVAGTYSVEVTDFGAYTNLLNKERADVTEVTMNQVTDPATMNLVSGAQGFSLKLNSVEIASIGPVTNLNDLVAAINEQAGEDVHAYIVNVGGEGEAADYFIGIESNHLAADQIQLTALQVPAEGETTVDVDLLRDPGPGNPLGSSVKYKVNGRSVETVGDSRTVTIAPGVTLDLLKAGSASVTVSRSISGIESALNGFAASYNSVVAELTKHHGKDAGALKGLSVVTAVENALRGFSRYDTGEKTATGISSLAVLGLETTRDGKLSLNKEIFDKITKGNFDSVLSFLGSATGGGFLKTGQDLLDSVSDDYDGFLPAESKITTDAIKAQDDRIAAEQDKVDRMTANLQAQMAAADAAIALMEQQVQYFTTMFESMRIASQSLK